MASLKPRAANLVDLANGTGFLFVQRPLPIDEDAAPLLAGDAPALLARVHAALDAAESWDTGVLEEAVRRVAEEAAVKLGQVAQPLRAALTGRRTSPGIFDVLDLLGREESSGGSPTIWRHDEFEGRARDDRHTLDQPRQSRL